MHKLEALIPSSDTMKPRLFSTLRYLQHENPLVSGIRQLVRQSAVLTLKGSAADWEHPPHATWFARAPKDKRCQEGDRSIVGERRSWEVYHLWSVPFSKQMRPMLTV
jgi:hypothetical protein